MKDMGQLVILLIIIIILIVLDFSFLKKKKAEAFQILQEADEEEVVEEEEAVATTQATTTTTPLTDCNRYLGAINSIDTKQMLRNNAENYKIRQISPDNIPCTTFNNTIRPSTETITSQQDDGTTINNVITVPKCQDNCVCIGGQPLQADENLNNEQYIQSHIQGKYNPENIYYPNYQQLNIYKRRQLYNYNILNIRNRNSALNFKCSACEVCGEDIKNDLGCQNLNCQGQVLIGGRRPDYIQPITQRPTVQRATAQGSTGQSLPAQRATAQSLPAQIPTISSYNCNTKEVWSDDKRDWCCDNLNKGCLEQDVSSTTSTTNLQQPMVSPYCDSSLISNNSPELSGMFNLLFNYSQANQNDASYNSRPSTVGELMAGDDILGISDKQRRNEIIIMFEKLLNNDTNLDKFIDFMEQIVNKLRDSKTSQEQKNKLFVFVEYLLNNQMIHSLKGYPNFDKVYQNLKLINQYRTRDGYSLAGFDNLNTSLGNNHCVKNVRSNDIINNDHIFEHNLSNYSRINIPNPLDHIYNLNGDDRNNGINIDGNNGNNGNNNESNNNCNNREINNKFKPNININIK